MTPAFKRKLCLGLAIASALGLPLTAVALLMLFNPYAIALSSTFSVHNALGEPVQVTPIGGIRMASGEHHWRVLRQAAVAFAAAPALRQARIPVAAGEAVSIRANFDDLSLGLIAVSAPGTPERAVIVDANAAAGACCYAPKSRRIVIDQKALVPTDRRLSEAVERADRAGGMWTWYGIVGAGLAILAVFPYSVRRYRALGRPS